MKKLLYIVLDGLGDRPIAELKGKTPLEAAKTPNMDSLTKKGKLGTVYTVGKGIAPESDIAVISILGYDAHKYYTGRGPLESFAEGIDIKDGDLAYRVNFATKEKDSDKIVDRRVGRNLTTEEAATLTKEINTNVKLDDATFTFKNTIGHRGILVIRKDGKLNADVSNTDPAYEKHGYFGVAKPKFEKIALKCEAMKDTPQAYLAAELTNQFVDRSTETLNNAEVNKKRESEGKLAGNLILCRDAGDRLPKFPKMSEIYKMKFGCFVEMPVEKGIALLTGMDVVDVPLPTGDPKKDYPLRAQKTLESMKIYDALYIHIKGPDEPAHDGDFKKKLSSIEAIDKFFFGKLLSNLDKENCVIAITADHATPCKLKAHSDDPVPLLISGGDIKSDGLNSFSESNAEKGSLGQLNGPEILPLFIKHLK